VLASLDHNLDRFPRVGESLLCLEGYRMDAPALRIGQVAEATGLPVKTVRFYCDEGLIGIVSRSPGGYRLFDPSVVGELGLIRTLRAMDVPLAELKRILDVRRAGHCNCGALKSSIQGRIRSIEDRLSELAAMKAELGQLLSAWEECGGLKTA
jgi:MerR family transcriptional regulator, copper efflux regulator